MMERIVGFYPSRPFWALEAPNLQEASDEVILRRWMEDIVLDYQRAPWRLQVCRDGKFMFRMHALEEAPPSSESSQSSASLVDWWAQYLDIINCLNLVFESSVLQYVNIGF